ncbi:MAG: sulfurtransferase TusA family protein [Candidatus Heimdallarchaeota archaeon]
MELRNVVNVLDQTCPIPLIETRKALRKLKPGEELEIIGNHGASKIEIPMAVESLGDELLRIEEETDKKTWHIIIRKV